MFFVGGAHASALDLIKLVYSDSRAYDLVWMLKCGRGVVWMTQ